MSNSHISMADTQAELDTLVACLADSTRRRLLATLYESAGKSLPLERVARSLTGSLSRQDGDEHLQQIRLALTHVHLPKLERGGLITRTEQGTVHLSSHPIYEDDAVVELLTNATGTDEGVDGLFRALNDSRRRITLNAIRFRSAPLSTETLAREVAAVEADTASLSPSEQQVASIHLSLQHTHIPLLVDAGLLEYDESEGAVSYKQRTDIRGKWMHTLLNIPLRTEIQL